MIDCVNPFYNDIINIMCMLGMMVGMSESWGATVIQAYTP